MHHQIFTKAALVADSLSLGPHWVYNQSKVARVFPDGIFELSAPVAPYHEGKEAGDLTHYGDQLLWLSELTQEQGGFDLAAWRTHWLKLASKYDGYLDGATKETLESDGMGVSTSKDLAGVSRIAALMDLDLDEESTVLAAREQTGLTHGKADIVEAAEFFVRALFKVKAGMGFEEALEAAAQAKNYEGLDPSGELVKAKEMTGVDLLEASTQLGLTCYVPDAFPLTLYVLLHHGESFETAMSQNGLCGGDTSARAMLLALFFVARDGDVGQPLYGKLKLNGVRATDLQIKVGANSVEIETADGNLAAVLHQPAGEVRAYALFAHCFTCGKDFYPATRIASRLAEYGIATLRVDFAGVGKSSGKFEETSFLTNVDDLTTAAQWLRVHAQAPRLLIGHSLGGAAVYAAAGLLEEVQAVVSIGAPSDPSHVVKLFADKVEEIETKGMAEVSLAGRSFSIGKKFLDDIREGDHMAKLRGLSGHKLVMHAPDDATVPMVNAGEIYSALTHPKSFIALANADHLLTRQKDTDYVASVISAWADNALQDGKV